MDSTVTITARVLGKDLQGLIQILTGREISVKKVREGIIVELPKNSLGIYEIPPEIANKATLLINAAEQGGGMTNTGQATIVCDVDGKALTPYYIVKSGNRAGETHALFATHNTIVTVAVYRHHQNTITITKHTLVRNGNNTAKIQSEVLWNGGMTDDCSDAIFDCFRGAMIAALNKASCYHCREPHFVAVPE